MTPAAVTSPAPRLRAPWPLLGSLTLTGFIVIALWIRTDSVPAPSGGDEVWWGEAAYHWLNEGVMRWACMDDVRGSGIMTFWPPVITLFEAACFKIFGFNALGLMAQSSIVATLIMAATYQLTRLLGFGHCRALLTACALFGLMMIERRLLQVRMENLTALCSVLFVIQLVRCQPGFSPARPVLPALLGGLALGIGLFCYYPQSPFLLLGAAGGFWFLRPSARSGLGFALGLLVPLVAGAWWILPHWELFARQILNTGTERFLALGNLLRPFSNFAHAQYGSDLLLLAEKWLVLGLGLVALLRGPTSLLRGFGCLIIAGSLPMFCFDPSPQVFPAIFAVCLLFHPQFALLLPHGSGWLRAAQVGLLLAAVGKLALVAFTGFYQSSGRDYDFVAAEIRAAVDPRARIGISQEAWLALRPNVAAENLHLLVHSYTTLGNLPRVANTPAAADYFDYLVLRTDRLEVLAAVYPWLGPALNHGQFQLVRVIAPPFRPLPWAFTPNYNLAVYQRIKRPAP